MELIKNKSAFSAVIAIGLLLVVSVVSVVTLSGWYDNYSSSIFTKSESGGNSNSILINKVISDSSQLKVFAKSSNSYALVNTAKVNGVECSMLGSNVIDSNLTEILLDCSGSSGTNEVILVTNSGVYTYQFGI